MDVNSIISLARKLTSTNSNQVDDATAVQFLNLAYHDLESDVESSLNQDYFWDIWTEDLVKGQNEYVLESSGPNKEGMNKILRVEAKFNSNDKYRDLLEANTLNSYNEATDYLGENLNQDNGFFDIKENSIFIYPTPTENVGSGLKVHTTITLPDLQLADGEDKIFPGNSQLRRYHYVLAIGMKQYIFGLKSQTELKNDAINEYKSKKREVLTYLSPRYSNPIVSNLPNSNNLKN